MEKAVRDLKEVDPKEDTNEICRLMDIVIMHASTMTNEELVEYSLDPIIKKILKHHMCIQIIEKIGDMLTIIRDPRNFYDELVEFMKQPTLVLPTLMLMYQLKQCFEFEYDDFYNKLGEVLVVGNVESEGFLLFMLKCLEDQTIEIQVVEKILQKLSWLSVEVSSDVCIRIVYCILVIMRMHPASFKYLSHMKEMDIHLHSLDSIKNIVKRIYAEAVDAKKRPKMVFLQNFAFPDLIK